MPQRLLTVATAALGVLGLGVLVVLALLRVDAHRAAATGPAWKRRLVGAALALLAATGDGAKGQAPPLAQPPRAEPPAVTKPAAPELAGDDRWQQVCHAWDQGRKCLSGFWGTLPPDAEMPRWAFEALTEARGNVIDLEADRALTPAEAGLLRADIQTMSAGVAGRAGAAVKELEARAPLLDKLAAQETLKPALLMRVLDTVRRQAGALSDSAVAAMGATERAEAVRVRQATLGSVRAIRARLGVTAAAPEATPEWATTLEAWKLAASLANLKRCTKEQRAQADATFAAARDAAATLAAADLLTFEEAGLLIKDIDLLAIRVPPGPEADQPRFQTCYMPALVRPGDEYFDRVSLRLPLLQSLAAGGKVHPAVLRKVLPAVEADLKALAAIDVRRAGVPDDGWPERVARLQKQAAEELGKLKKQMGQAN